MAAEKTISSGSCGCHNNAGCDCGKKQKFSATSVDLKELFKMHLKEMQISE
jgi:hypothetical protein